MTKYYVNNIMSTYKIHPQKQDGSMGFLEYFVDCLRYVPHIWGEKRLQRVITSLPFSDFIFVEIE